jgi:hypothetical protein
MSDFEARHAAHVLAPFGMMGTPHMQQSTFTISPAWLTSTSRPAEDMGAVIVVSNVMSPDGPLFSKPMRVNESWIELFTLFCLDKTVGCETQSLSCRIRHHPRPPNFQNSNPIPVSIIIHHPSQSLLLIGFSNECCLSIDLTL